MPQKQADGSVLYKCLDEYSDVLLHGTSIADLLPVEVLVKPDGWGYALTQKKLGEADKPVKKWIDGQTRNYMYWGPIEVRPL